MILRLIRFSPSSDDTLGLLFIDGLFHSFTIEDEFRSEKVQAETRIPEGAYEISLRTYGSFHNRYSKRFSTFHKGMLELKNVPGFTDILIHPGNTEEDTEGCILVGDGIMTNRDKNGSLIGSVDAYKSLYNQIVDALSNNEAVTIRVMDSVNGGIV